MTYEELAFAVSVPVMVEDCIVEHEFDVFICMPVKAHRITVGCTAHNALRPAVKVNVIIPECKFKVTPFLTP